MKGRFFVSLLLVLILVPVVSAYPQAYPTKPIMLMVAYAAGGSTDVGARILAAIAEKELGQPVVVINKAGAGGQIGWTELARQKPDGYYLGFIGLPTLNTVILDPDRKATFGIDSFTYIINHVLDPGVIYVRADSPYKTLKDLIDDAKKRPGQLKGGSTGILGDDHLAMLMMEEAAGVKFRIVIFDGDPPHVTSILGGETDFGFLNVIGITPRVKGGQLRALAVMDKERSKFYPDVPTTVELGYPTVISSSARGIAGPKGIPEPILKKIQAVFKKAMEDPDHMDKADKAGLTIRIMVGGEYRKFVMGVHEKVKRPVEEARKSR